MPTPLEYPAFRRFSARLSCCLVVFLAMGLRSGLAGERPTPDALDFGNVIRPILAGNCFKCHGPDDGDRQAGLRLDSREGATAEAESGNRAIVPDKPDESELVRRIFSEDPDERMPPPDSNRRLSDAEKKSLRDWVAAGAKYTQHWSLVKPRRTEPPTVQNNNWPKNEIDRFILSRLEAEHLQPSPEADRPTLIRRLYLDLVGLLPTPQEVDEFVADPRADAYEQLVDRLLALPAYGERWARRWLDLARYADTNGYEKDRPRSIWPYRDWVIKALNDDMPFDQFTVEQIAGDMLPDATLSQRVATGFHRNTMINEEGGIDVAEFRFHSVVDRVATTGAVWLGLTIGCAQCHTHKFDPISQREYYGLFALLNNADEIDIDVPQEDIAAKRDTIQAEIDRRERELIDQCDPAKLAQWIEKASVDARAWQPVTPGQSVSTGGATMTVQDDRSVLVTGDKPNQDTYVVELTSQLPRVTAIRLEVLPDESLPMEGPGRAPLFSEGDFLLGEFLLEQGNGQQWSPVKLTDASHSYADNGRSAAQTIDGQLDTGWSIKGRTGEAHRAVYRLAEPLQSKDRVRFRVTLQQRYIHQMTIGRFRISLLDDERPTKALDLPADVEAILVQPADQQTPEQTARLRAHYLTIAPELAEQYTKIVELRRSMPKQPTTMVMQERLPQHARITKRAHRGEFLNQREPVEPGVPKVLHPLPEGKHDRLTLARWLVDEQNPLVARVTMNRHWQAIFGRGVVRTTEDFGLRGDPPSHGELLDWLATEFMRRSWSVKQMHRLMVTSATYRQQSRITPELQQRDPTNVLLARGPRVRVEAEVVRDTALSASGLLVQKLGGSSVFPPQPPGVADLAYGAPPWPTSVGPDRYRRGLYTYQKRASAYATFVTFDAPSGENCLVRRERSNTPLQALTLLNDTVFTEAAQALAERVLREGPKDFAGRARLAFRLCLVRQPSKSELAALQNFHDQQLDRFAKGELDASKFARPGEGFDQRELAAWSTVARVLMNLDEFVVKE